jgi:arabinosaccharide transport system substrate-binding protein
MRFPLGKPILVMIIVALATLPFVVVGRTNPADAVSLWLFADAHEQTYRSILDEFERETGIKVDIQLINGRAMPVRLQSMFMSQRADEALPDLVELEISWVGRFFRPPVPDVGLLPLDRYLAQNNWGHRIVRQRFTPWSKEGVIFGVPHDVHPVTLTYRKDLFDAAGVDLESAKTWPEFQERCLEFQDYWRANGHPQRHALELPQSSPEFLVAMLAQRGVNLIDDREQIHFTDPRVAQTISLYAQFVAGARKIASESAGNLSTGLRMQDLQEGNLCSFLTADWSVYGLKAYAPGLEGKLRMMPLPRFDPDDPPTTTFGGTMIGITRNSRRHDDAWKLIEFLYLSDAGLKARQKFTNILPPLIEQWDDPIYHRADPYFGGQKVDELYIELASQIPRRYVTPASNIASIQLAVVLSRAVDHVKRHGPAGLEQRCHFWCAQAADDLRRRIEHGKLQP